jgi:hypothetical protein
MRTREWFQTRQTRAEDVIRRGEASVGSVVGAFSQVTDDPPDEEDAKLVARALRILPAHAYLRLLRKTADQLQQAMDCELYACERHVADALEAGALAGETASLNDLPTRNGLGGKSVGRLALALLALIWAIGLPPEDSPRVVY